MNAWEVLGPYLGAGGVTTIVVAYLSYRSAVYKGRRGEPERSAGMVGISALLADADSISKLSISLGQVALSADKIALITIESREDVKEIGGRLLKTMTDLVEEVRDLRRAVEDKK